MFQIKLVLKETSYDRLIYKYSLNEYVSEISK